eukprot:TRINITY_DN2_c0_g1_i1.p1 TRINITY_DN2_c0_g1~~TRINITY_DN2_c0_g1_i1.p1  ORF type:complete len:656 (+),score=78.94 TRINITY_DN2_c0_g1_i1:119-2086(+)
MSSAQYSVSKRSSTASDNPKRSSSNSYSGGDWFSTSGSLPPKHATPPPQPAARTTQSPSTTLNASDSAQNGPSAFQPRCRGQRHHPPQNRAPTTVSKQELSTSRSRQLNRTQLFLSNDTLRTIQTRSAPNLNFSSAVSPIQFRHTVPLSPAPPSKSHTPVVNLDDDAVPTSVPSSHEQSASPQHFCHPYPDDLPPVPKREGLPPSNNESPIQNVLNPDKHACNKLNVHLRSEPSPADRTQQAKRMDTEPISIEDDPSPVSTLKPKLNSHTAQQQVILASRSSSPPPEPNATAKRLQPNENTKFARKRTRQSSSYPLQPANPAQRRSLRLRDKHTPEGTYSEALRPFSHDFNTAYRYSPDLPEIPRSMGTKRPRPMATPCNDNKVTVVKDKPAKRAKHRLLLCYERTPYDHDQALSLLKSRSKRFISLSFLGISDGDLRNLFDGDAIIPDIPSGGRHVQINNNRLNRMTSYIFQRFRDMKVVSLTASSNQLTHIDQSIVMCNELRTLDLSRNNLRSLPERFGDLSSLLCLKVSDNKLTKLPPALYLLRKLKILNVARNNLESFPEDITEAGNALTALDVSGNHAFQNFPVCCKNWDRLEDLILTGTEVFVYLTKKERRLRAKVLIEELAGKPLEKLKNRTRRKRSSVFYKETIDAS